VFEMEIMTVREVARYLCLAESTVYKLVSNGGIPAKKIGGAWRFSRQNIDAWLRDQPGDGLHRHGGMANGK
jgi:excisionase family DNA binding protein